MSRSKPSSNPRLTFNSKETPTMIRKPLVQAVTALALTAAAATPALAAEYLRLDSFSNSYMNFSYTFTDGMGTVSTGSAAGEFAGTFGPNPSGVNPSFETYCVSLRQTFTWGSPFQVTRQAFAGNAYNTALNQQVQLNKLGWLMANDASYAVTNATTSAAMQLAIWEIVYDNGADVTSGMGFKVTAGSAAAQTQANAWLAGLAASNHQYIAERLYNPDKQDQLVVTVPEPETYAMFLAGLGMMGFVARRRSQRA
ncbi:MAG: PEP-CTERM sorting domain-containing protein [Rhodocyclaceae bacterium]|nr:PEP-CTERM sorting domain-containing protein [Rhodocyclaceae bacterium]